ncbi:MAG: OmpA family protein [Prevotellaceae bacterium]|jgi:outer membrane protein OmpA-like peptidoglycan-associated protein/tetratricopeptide (TPR) repeat protein|nr:OmpA family protein [Prevotellaceae bacterium]
MKKYTLILLAAMCAHLAFAQNQNVEFDKKFFPNDRDGLKKAREQLLTGTDLYNVGFASRKVEALPYLLRAYDFNPNNAQLNIMIGDCYLRSAEKEKAVEYLERAAALPSPAKLQAYKLLGEAYHLNYEFDKAIGYFKEYRDRLDPGNAADYAAGTKYVNKKIAECETAKELVANPVRVFIDNLGSVVNTKYPEYGPVINADGSAMYFTSCRPDVVGGTFDEDAGSYAEDIYVTTRENGAWTQPKNLGEPINTPDNDAVAGISPDGEVLFVFFSENGGDLGYSELQGNKWSEKKSFGSAVNSPAHEASASLSPDGKTLYFVSNRGSANGSHHIYCSKKAGKDGWQPAQPVSVTSVSEYDERAVFIHPNGKTMYFSSNGLNTMGGYDIFRSDYENGQWSTPVNMGYPINTPDDDLFFMMSASGRYAYFSSFRAGGQGSHDIYQITFIGAEKHPMNASEDNLIAYMQKPLSEISVEKRVEETSTAVTLLKGIVKDAKTKKPILAKIDVTDNELGEVIASFETNSQTGRYMVSLPSGKNYGLVVKADNYLFYSENIDVRGNAEYQEIYKDIELNGLAVGAKVVLRNLFFESGKAVLTKESVTELNRLLVMMTDMPKLRIEISGHTDNVGSAAFNKKLSQERAKAVVDYLVKDGIDISRLTYVGYGFDQPVADNKTAAGKAQNRRTEFKIIGNE